MSTVALLTSMKEEIIYCAKSSMCMCVVFTCFKNTEFDIFARSETLKPFVIITLDLKQCVLFCSVLISGRYFLLWFVWLSKEFQSQATFEKNDQNKHGVN